MEEKLKRRPAFHLLGKSAFAPWRRRGGSAADPRSLAGDFTASPASQPLFPSLFPAALTPESTPGKETVAPIPVGPHGSGGVPATSSPAHHPEMDPRTTLLWAAETISHSFPFFSKIHATWHVAFNHQRPWHILGCQEG